MTAPSRRLVFAGSALVLGIVLTVACSDSKPNGADPGNGFTSTNGGSCATPNEGCPCESPGSEVACAVTIHGDNDFIWCQQGKRQCVGNAWGACATTNEVGIRARNPGLTMASGLGIRALGTNTTCNGGGASDVVMACATGKNIGDVCATDADCAKGVKRCSGSTDGTTACKDDADCNDVCTRYNGTCAGGSRANQGCNSDPDCVGGGTCTIPATGGADCTTYSGVCDSTGPTNGQACASNADCGGGTCDPPKFGVCLGGKRNGKKCKHPHQCTKGGGVCNLGETNDAGNALDPCDPYCNVTSDTALGLSVTGFNIIDGGLTPIGAFVVTCGDSIVSPGEACDDGNTQSGDGCSSTCKFEPNFHCPTPGSPCVPATCGNGVKEGLEECDDGPWVADGTGVIKDRPYDGCYQCQRELNCPVGAGPGPTACTAVCGDGIVFPGEACDDGNLVDLDGCSSTCTIETGATCTNNSAPLPAFLDVPVIYRDFKSFGGPNGNPTPAPDFQFHSGPAPWDSIPHKPGGTGGGCVPGVSQGIPQLSLNPTDRAPDLLDKKTCILDAASFATWYRDAPNTKTILGKFLRLAAVSPTGTYRFDSANDPAYNLPDINCGNATPTTTCKSKNGFFPIDGVGFGNETNGHNYSFTSEVRFPFTYTGGEVLTFVGDDDLWVWIGGRKVVDIGNPHGAETGSVALNLTGTVSSPASATAVPSITFTPGQTYEIAVFQAERNSTGSNYTLTLAGFNRQTSTCTPPPATAPPVTFVRDFEAICPAGTRFVWQLFRWKATVPAGDKIEFRAATADTQATLPASPPPNAPATVPIGTATETNSPAAGPVVFVNDQVAGVPQPVSLHLQNDGGGATSKRWLRVYMTFTGKPSLYDWQQLYDCIPAE